ncbi:uncharacterized protein LOC107371396 isoform X1 [Tetranychus urticae]|nr:uncharacterized protein LOC107371396 isoform X1 [Tetranychus urticae]
MIGFFRLLTLMLVTDESVHIYLGDGLYSSKQASIIYFLCIITLGSLYGFGEITLYQESSGYWKPMRVLDQLRSPNLNPSSIGLTRSYLTKACSLIHLVAKHGVRIMNCAPLYMIFIIEAPIVAELSLKENPMFNFYCLLWSFFLACPFIYHMAGNFGRAGYLIMYGICSILRLRSLETLVKHSSCQLTLIERDINSLVSAIISFCNEMEQVFRSIRFGIFYAVFVIAFMADVQLFFGVIIPLEPALVAHLLAVNAAVILFALGLTVYFCGVYLNTLQSTVVQFHRICTAQNISVLTKLKINELMDRMAGPYNGIEAGWFGTLTTKFFVIFLVENASTMMLFAVNVVGYLIK